MKKLFLGLSVLVLAAGSQAATTNITPWTPLFRGIDHISVRVTNLVGGAQTRAVECLRIALTDPDVRLLPTPACTNCSSPDETRAANTSYYLEQYRLQVAVNGMFFSGAIGPGDLPLNDPSSIFGLAISRGTVVSAEDESPHSATMFFSSNNVPTFIPRNWPPVDSNGVLTAITGNILLLTNGMNAGTNAVDSDPRTAIGISQDKHYLYLLTVDGRQSGWSDGANFYETADWLARFGAYEGMNIDGGGSTTMAMADCQGKSIRLNKPSYLLPQSQGGQGRERIIGHNFGIYAAPLPTDIKNLTAQPGTTTAIITWDTTLATDTQVEYGLTTSLGSATPLDTRPVRAHVATLTGLISGSNYYFRARSSDGVTSNTLNCSFTTTGAVARTEIFGLTTAWKYTTNNLDGVNWKGLADDDSGWFGPSNACFHIENSTQGSPTFAPRNTLLPPGFVVPIFRTYYFRTPFQFSGTTAGVSLTFSNYIDDGAIFYLNGSELNRIRMTNAPIVYFTNFAAGSPPCTGTGFQGDSTIGCPDVFTVSGNLLTNLVQGTNVVAVELHNVSGGTLSQDVFFGSALFANIPGASVPQLFIRSENGVSTIFWNGQGFTLQQSSDLSSPSNWSDVPGPVTQSSYTVANNPSLFYRLRN